MDHALQFSGLAAAIVIFCRAESLLNLLGSGCKLAIRLSFLLLAVGAAAVGVNILAGYSPPAPVVLALIGMALFLASERRIKALLRRRI